MMTSAAETPSDGWISVGMPRPLSVTVQEPSGLSVTVTSVGVAGQRLVDGVVDHFVDHVVQARAVVGVADIHARPLADRVEALQDLDGIRAIFRGFAGCDVGRIAHEELSCICRRKGAWISSRITRLLMPKI